MVTRRIDPLRSDVPIADEKGNPSKFFQRQWNTQIAATGALPDIEAQVEQLETDVAALQDVEIIAGTGLDGGGVLGTDPTITLDLADTAVTPGTYGDATNVAQIIVDAQGRLTSATNVPITGGGGGGGFGFNPPPASAFPTTVNGGTAAGTLTDNTNLGLIINQTAGGANDWHLRLQAGAPPMSGTRSYRAWIKFNAQLAVACVFGIILRNSSANRHFCTGLINSRANPIQNFLANYTSTAFNATIGANNVSVDDLWVRIDVDSSGNVSRWISADGSVWLGPFSPTTLATYVGTYDQVGFGLRPGAGPLYCSGAIRAFEIVDF